MTLHPDLKGKTALVTGAGRGIGKAVSLALAWAGAHVVLTARTESQIASLADQIIKAGGAATAIAADVASEREMVEVFRKISQKLGRLLQPDDIAQSVMYLLSLSDRAAVDQIYIRRRNSAPF